MPVSETRRNIVGRYDNESALLSAAWLSSAETLRAEVARGGSRARFR